VNAAFDPPAGGTDATGATTTTGTTGENADHGGGARLFDLDLARVERALHRRSRYRYVRPRVLRDGPALRVVSPNCSRNVDPEGGEIDIARLEPVGGGWLLLSRDHERLEWRAHSQGTLAQLLALLVADASREFWP
jgi:hypothetical protein